MNQFKTIIRLALTKDELAVVRAAIEQWEGYLIDNIRTAKRLKRYVDDRLIVEFLAWEFLELGSAVEMESRVNEDPLIRESLAEIYQTKIKPHRRFAAQRNFDEMGGESWFEQMGLPVPDWYSSKSADQGK